MPPAAVRQMDMPQRGSSAGILVGNLQAGLNQTAASGMGVAGGMGVGSTGMTAQGTTGTTPYSQVMPQQQQQHGIMSRPMPAPMQPPQYGTGNFVQQQQHQQPILGTGQMQPAATQAQSTTDGGILTGDKRPREPGAGAAVDGGAAGKKAKAAAGDAKKGAQEAPKEEFSNDLLTQVGIDVSSEEASYVRVVRPSIRHKCNDQPFLEFRSV